MKRLIEITDQEFQQGFGSTSCNASFKNAINEIQQNGVDFLTNWNEYHINEYTALPIDKLIPASHEERRNYFINYLCDIDPTLKIRLDHLL